MKSYESVYRSMFVLGTAGSLTACVLPVSPRSAASQVSACAARPAYAKPHDGLTVPITVHARINFSGWYVFKGVCVLLDGDRLAAAAPSTETDGASAQLDWPTSVARSGTHELTIFVRLDGASEFRGSTLAAGYRFELKSKHSFSAEAGHGLSIVANATESRPDGDRTPLERRPIVSWEENPSP